MIALALLACSSPAPPPLPSPGLVVSVQGGEAPGLVVMAPDGSGARRLTDGTFDAGAAWSPDGGRIVFTRMVETPAQLDDPCGLPFHGAAMVLDPVSGDVRLIADIPVVIGSLRWSPDGSKIAFWTGWGDPAACDRDGFGETRVWIAAADGSGARELGLGAMPEWSPDGEALAIVKDGSVYTVSPDGAPIRTVYTADGGKSGAAAAVWSRDGAMIGFATSEGAVSRLWTAPSADGAPTLAAPGAAWEIPVAYTPGGDLLLASTLPGPPDDPEIVKLSPDGTRTRLASHAGRDLEPALSPDGTQVVFRSNRDGAWEIYVVSLDVSGLTRLTHDAVAVESGPAWRP